MRTKNINIKITMSIPYAQPNLNGVQYMKEIIKGDCHSCDFRHSCCTYPVSEDNNCEHWKLGRCYTCKFVDNNEDAWFLGRCEALCFSGCEKYKRDWKKTFKLRKFFKSVDKK